jgi:hypothetical protein
MRCAVKRSPPWTLFRVLRAPNSDVEQDTAPALKARDLADGKRCRSLGRPGESVLAHYGLIWWLRPQSSKAKHLTHFIAFVPRINAG